MGFVDHTYGTIFQTADVQLLAAPDPNAAHILPSRHGLLFMAPLGGGLWRLIISRRHGSDGRPPAPTRREIQRHVEERAMPGLIVGDVVRTAGVVLHHAIADSFAVGKAALVGDAAHVHSPAGGMGMNTGIQDAFDLAVTLASIHRGDADPLRALDAFHTRRHRAAREVVGFTDRIMRLVTVDRPGVHLIRTAVFAIAGRVPAVPRRIALANSCVTRTPRRTDAPALLRRENPDQ